MEIRRLQDIRRAHQARPAASSGLPAQAGPAGQAPRDAFQRQSGDSAEREAPFWLVRMSADRLARRRYLSDAAMRAAERTERRWIAQLAESAGPAIARWAAAHPAPSDLAAWQALADALCAEAGFQPVRAVWLPGMPDGRGQFLFRVEGNLLQLRPGAPGSRREWVATVAHETFHHLQQELVTALYRGEPTLAAPLDELAGRYRDARAVYETLGPHCPPERHRRQALEVGAWAFGEAIARRLEA